MPLASRAVLASTFLLEREVRYPASSLLAQGKISVCSLPVHHGFGEKVPN